MSDVAVVQLQYEPGHLSERLRIRKGSICRWTCDGRTTDYRVVFMSMPNERGRVEVRVERP